MFILSGGHAVGMIAVKIVKGNHVPLKMYEHYQFKVSNKTSDTDQVPEQMGSIQTHL